MNKLFYLVAVFLESNNLSYLILARSFNLILKVYTK